MTGLVAMDESGDLGRSGSRYFVMAAIVSTSPRKLKSVVNLLSKGTEYKWSNSSLDKRIDFMKALSALDFYVV